MANQEMHELWNGELSGAWVQTPDRYDRMLEDLGRLALDAARLQPGESVLDVGCGSGALSRAAAAVVGPAGSVTGVDISQPLLELARSRGGAQVVHADAQVHDFAPDAYDAVISRFGVMFFDDQVAAFANLRTATRPGGRLAFVAWQPGPMNAWVMTAIAALLAHVPLPEVPSPGEPGPFAFGDPDHVRGVLDGAGWRDVAVEGVETTLLVGGPGDVDSAMEFYEQDGFGRLLLSKADPEQRAAALAALRETVAERIGPDGLRLGAAVWLVTATA